jgi:hypothetical protein
MHRKLAKDVKLALDAVRSEIERPHKPHEWMFKQILKDTEVVLATLLYHVSLVDCTYPTKKIESDSERKDRASFSNASTERCDEGKPFVNVVFTDDLKDDDPPEGEK